ncbi:MAG: DNA lyase, partial [Acidianus infernus]|nr:DNA lyase [Acidianus infernus]
MLRNLVKNVKLRAKVLERAEEFKLNNKAGEDVWFRELVLCILTSNSSFISAYIALN